MISEWLEKCLSHRTKERETLAHVLEPALALAPDRAAIYFEDRSITYRELDEAANRIANGLLALGIRRGDRIAVHIDNRPEFMEVFIGVMRTGAILVPTNVMYTAEEMEHIVGDSGAKALFVVSTQSSKLAPIVGKLPELSTIVELGEPVIPGSLDFVRFKREAATSRPVLDAYSDDTATIQYTSGTTGKPKGAMVSHRNILAVLDNTADLQAGPEALENDSILLVLPLFHAYALNLAMNRAFLGVNPIVLVHRFDAERIFSLIEKYRVTFFYGAPPMYFAFVNTPGLDKYDVSCLRGAFSGAAPLPVVILEKFKKLSGVEINEGYGLSETAPTLTSNMAGPLNKAGSVGPPIPGVELRVVDENDNDVPPGEVGEIVARGPNIFKGYWRREAETAEAMRNGWFHTGDLGRVDADGYYYIVDRKKDMVLVSGFNVYPIEVENVILRHPKILDCAIVGVKSDYQGESVKAVVVLRPGQSLDLAELQTYCREHLAAFKIPRLLEIRSELPKNATGKVLKRELRG